MKHDSAIARPISPTQPTRRRRPKATGLYTCAAARRCTRYWNGPRPAIWWRRIGFLEAGAASVNRHFLEAFQSGLRELGHIDGNNVVIDARWAEGRAERFPELLGELIQLKPDVIVVASTLGAVAGPGRSLLRF